MLATITIAYGIPIITTKDFKETAAIIKTIAKREQNSENKEFGIRLEKKPITTKEQQEFIIESLPGIGPSLAKELLKQFKTIKKIMNSSEDKLKEIDKLGSKKAKSIKEILDKIYKN